MFRSGPRWWLLLTLIPALANPLIAAAPPASDLEGVVSGWTATIKDPAAPRTDRIEALVRRGETLRGLGRLEEAELDLHRALAEAETTGARALRGVAAYGLAQVYARQGRGATAEALLRGAIAEARALDRPGLTAAIANALGNVLAESGRTAEARTSYHEALALAQAARDPGLIASGRRNLAGLASDPPAALRELRAARTAAEQVTALDERAELLLGIGVSAGARGAAGHAFAEPTLRAAESLARSVDLARIEAQALAALGQLREEQGARAAAMGLTEQAIAAAPADAHDLRYAWEWRVGRLARAAGAPEQAVAAYRRAVEHLERVRHLLPLDDEAGRSSFRETFGPIYLELADLLLQQATAHPETDQAQALLLEVQQRVEQIKLDELRDYLRDACLQPRRKAVGLIDPAVAVLYPVILPDRLELLVGIGGRRHRFTSPAAPAALAAAVAALRRELTRPPDQGGSPTPAARSLYDWLIAPITPLLERGGVSTLAVIPDGPLRTIPFATLTDGEHWLVERYALVTVPGLTLLDPQPLPPSGRPALLAGLSRPGPVVGELPRWWAEAMLQANRAAGRDIIAPAGRGSPVRTPPVGRGFTASTGTAPPLNAAAPDLVAALTLPGVAPELDAIAATLPARTLEDEAFRLDPFLTALTEHDHRIVHIASHGLFGSGPEENFVLTYDRLLHLGTLAEALRPRESSQTPLELLVLSACQTAEGDDRTPLGLAGVALQAGARSALGSLWPVDDAATGHLMQSFYEHLRTPGTTRAAALRAAQLALLHNGPWRAPYYWAPFILVGNWL